MAVKMMPTPAARDYKDSGNEPAAQKRKSPCLPAFLKMLPTPKATECERSGKLSESKRDNPSLWFKVYQATGQKLSPLFVEWMMGFPIGHSELSAWAMQWFQIKQKKRLKY